MHFTQASFRSAAVLLIASAGLAACAVQHQPATAVQATKPTVTYAYNDDQGLVEATNKAQTYCLNYNSWPRTTDVYTSPQGGRNVSFICDQARPAPMSPIIAGASPGVVMAAPAAVPTVNYTYRDDRSLVDITNQAQTYCAGYSANAHSSFIANNTDGSRTMTFQCTRP